MKDIIAVTPNDALKWPFRDSQPGGKGRADPRVRNADGICVHGRIAPVLVLSFL